MEGNLPLVEDGLDLVLKLLSVLSLLKPVLGDDLLELFATAGELTGNLESGWQKMVVVNKFDEWLDL